MKLAKPLNVGSREALYNFAEKQILKTQGTTALDAAYEAAADAVSAVVRKKYPPADMMVLLQYERAELDYCIFISTGGTNYQKFSFRADDARAPHRPSGHCNHRTPHLLDEKQEKVFDAFVAADTANTAAVKARAADFKALIYASRTFEDLVAIWPAADEMRERVCGTNRALAVMSDEVLARIKADAATPIAEGE